MMAPSRLARGRAGGGAGGAGGAGARRLAGRRAAPRAQERQRPAQTQEGEESLFDALLDGLQGGRKQRRWYGAPSKEEERAAQAERVSRAAAAETEASAKREAAVSAGESVLVVGADEGVAAAAVTALVVAREDVAALVRDQNGADEAFGPYLSGVFAGSAGDATLLGRALLKSGAKAALCADSGVALATVRRLADLAPRFAEEGKALPAVVALNAPPRGLLAGLLRGDEARAADVEAAAREAAAAGIDLVVLRAPAALAEATAPPRSVELAPAQPAGASEGALTAEDAAAALAFACTADDFDASVGVYDLSAVGDNVVVSPAAK